MLLIRGFVKLFERGEGAREFRISELQEENKKLESEIRALEAEFNRFKMSSKKIPSKSPSPRPTQRGRNAVARGFRVD